MRPLIDDNLEQIGRLCRLYGMRKLELFGSILRPDSDPERSDVDLLVEFEPQVADCFANFLDLKEALEGLLGRRVDLVELRAIRNCRLRRYIEQSSYLVYEQRPLAPGVHVLGTMAEQAQDHP